MTRRGPAELLRTREGPQRPAFLELFFDLVFVFALAQLSHGLLTHLDWAGAFQTLVLLLAVWWVWTITAWITDLYDARQPAIQLLVIATMLGGLVMAATLPEAFGERGLVFAGAYVAIHVGRGIFLTLAMRGRELQRRTLRVLFWFCLSAMPWIAGALVHGTARGVLWALAAAVDYTAGRLRYPTPGLGPAPTSEWPIVAEHLSERYRQLFIIALGELILVSGSALSGSDFAADRAVAFVVSFIGTVLLWRIYIFRSGELLPGALAAAPDPDRLARSALVAHLIMLAGIVVAAVGDQLVIAHPTGHTRPAWIAVLLGGPALFLIGRAQFERVVFRRVSRDRTIGLLVLAALAPAMILLQPLLVAIAGTGVLAGVAVSDAARARGHPPEPPARPGGQRGAR
jgi:low temperature requirement protein LtrA